MRRLLARYRDRLRAFWQLILHEHTSPGRVAAAVVVGCTVGCTPLFLLHLWVCLLLAYVLGLNRLIVYGAANISIPPLVPLLGYASVQLGERALRGRWLSLGRADFQHVPVLKLAWRFFGPWLLGGVLLGAAIGLSLGGVCYAVLRHRARSSGRAAGPAAGPAVDRTIDQAIARATARYAGAHPRFRYYARAKYRMDRCYGALCALIPAGASVVDLGTGLGMLPVVLGELGEGRRALGVEWDADKAACGAEAAAGLPGVEVVTADLRAFAIPPCDAVTLVDVLHYHDAGEQRAILQRAAAALRPGGQLLIRDADASQRGGARWTRLVERAMVRLGWNRGQRVRFRPASDLLGDLAALGLSAERAEVAGILHPGNVLLRARKAA